MATVRNLAVEITANASKLRSEMSGAQRTIQNFGRVAQRTISVLTSAVTGLGVAAGGMVTAMTIRAGSIREMARMAEVTGVSLENMQKWTFAAKSLNIESDKMGDIFKDVSDKLGDFLVTGGGAASDMFEKLNINAREFIGLSPDESLLKIGRALDGLTQDEKIFFMEAIASDASYLLPLLDNNAEALRRLGDEAERSGNVLNESGVQAAVGLSEAWTDITDRAKGFFDQLTAIAAPALTEVFTKVTELIDNMGGIEVVANKAASAVLEGVIAMIDGLSALLETIDAVAKGWNNIMKFGRITLGGGAMVVESGAGLFGDNEISRNAGMFKESAFSTAFDAERNINDITGRTERRNEATDRARNFIQEHVDELKNNANTMERMDSQLEDLFNSNEGLFGRMEDKWDRIVEQASQQDNQASVKVDLNLTTDRGQLKGEIIASPEMARAMQQVAAREINNTARGVAA